MLPNHPGRSVPDPVTLSSVPELNSPQNWEFERDLHVQPAPMGFVNLGLAKLKPSAPSSSGAAGQELLNDLALPAASGTVAVLPSTLQRKPTRR